MQIIPVRKNNISEVVAQQLQDLIVQGYFKPGEPLPPERELCEQFEVSRTTIREALKILLPKSLLERKGRNTYVRENIGIFVESATLLLLSKKLEVNEFFEARLALERENIAIAVVKANDEDFEKLEKCISDAENPENPRELRVQCLSNFHQLLADATHNQVLSDIYSVIHAILVRVPRSPLDINSSSASHREILESIKMRDTIAAQILLQHHFKGLQTKLMK